MAKVDTSGAWLAKVPGVGTGERWDSNPWESKGNGTDVLATT